ncbi:MAG: signal recognition particle-docking protein FtsY [Actinomycetota bacterium]
MLLFFTVMVGFVVVRRQRSTIRERRDLDDRGGVDTIEGPSEVKTPPRQPEAEPAPKPEPEPTRGRVGSLRDRLSRLFGKKGLDQSDLDELEEVLLRADVGIAATTDILQQLKGADEDAMSALEKALRASLGDPARSLKRRPEGTSVWLITGVNGSGKTTTIGKLAAQEKAEGRSVVLAAADTFRAAADEQLQIWADRAGATIIKHQHGADPAAVVFDAAKVAAEGSSDLLVVDTAGRLQNKKNLMAELEKIHRVLEREAGPPDETLLILDATTGQNGLSQARSFAEAAKVTGIVLTKLDGSAKGGIVIAVERELGIPVKLVGIGEGIDDLAPFDPDRFVKDLLA